ncbi:hypothetical protein FHU38_000182 [Saccharomonospora amisosensis]|uniref:Uncharacterized protein n=1 Tax=Saccharomonospora amisosensis TaxID=1128677 RepID=A0A7X5ULF6_9PSEU|nr:hypothetical protein [Saccharomonospora amisosensis]
MAVTALSTPGPPGSRGIVEVAAQHMMLRPLGKTQLQGA